MNSVRDLKSIRCVAIEKAYKQCTELKGTLFLTSHFIERVNLRCDDQDRTFLFFAKCMSHLLKNWERHIGKYVEYKSAKDTLVFKVNGESDPRSKVFLQADQKFQIAAVTYWYNMSGCQQWKNHGKSDVIFRLPH